MQTATTLILGGTGKTGGRIIERLRAKGVPVRVGSRSATPPFDWEDQTTWPGVLRDVERVYISYFPDLAAPGATEVISALTQLAVTSGVRRLVLLSGRGEPEAQACEQIVRDCGAEWTLLRASWFAQNFSEGHLLGPILAGEVALPAKDVGEPFVDADDIADVAVAALTEDRHIGELYELTGPRLLTFADAIDEISRASWRDVRYSELSVEQYAATLTGWCSDAAHRTAEVSFLGSARRPECLDGGWRHARARPRSAGFFRVCAQGRSQRRVESGGCMKETNMLDVATLVAALGSGLIAGLFFAFSVAVMTALGKLPPAQGIAAMQSINVVIINPVFLAVFLGTAALCVFVLIKALLQWSAPGSAYLLAGSVLYLLGSFMVTMLFNVPRNDALAAVQPASEQAAALWANYLSTWTSWNHVRTVASLAASAALIVGRSID